MEKLHDALRDAARIKNGKKSPHGRDPPIARACARQSRGGVRGSDAGKKIVGRKRHLLVDTDGLIASLRSTLKVRVHAADVQDRDGATLVLDQIDPPLSKLELIWADGGYAGNKLAGWMVERSGQRPLRLEIVRRSDTQKGFAVLPRRWVVEHTFGWLNNFRRLSKDYEFRTHSSEAFIFLAASLLLISRLP